MCDGKQLLRQLNSFGFTVTDLADALAWAESHLNADIINLHSNT